MLNAVVKWSIAQRWLVVIASILIVLWGFRVLTQMPLDVFPNFAPPQVEIQTEATGLAPEEVEALVTRPIESAINGTPGVEKVRSSSAVGISVVKVIFTWDTDIYRARQLVTERLQQAQSQLPKSVGIPQISPVSSPIGAIAKYAFTTEDGGKTSLMEVRRIVDWQVKNRLLAVAGVTQIVIFGGDIRQYQVLIDPAKLQQYDVSLSEVTEAARKANVNAAGGFLTSPDRELLIRGIGRIESAEQLQQSAIKSHKGVPILLGQVADIKIGAELKRGDGVLNGKKAVVVIVNKQPTADTLSVTKAVEKAIAEIKLGLPSDVKVETTFRQEEFIEASLKNVEESLRDGTIIVCVILILFLMNWRTAIITLSAIPFAVKSIPATLMIMINLPLALVGGIISVALGGGIISVASMVGFITLFGVATRNGLLLVDNYNTKLSKGLPLQTVLVEGSLERLVAILMTALTSALGMVPLVIGTGAGKEILQPLAVVVLGGLFTSTALTLLVLPALYSQFGKYVTPKPN